MLDSAMDVHTLTATHLPEVPLTLEGASLLHQMLRVRWAAWRALSAENRTSILKEASSAIAELEKAGSAAFTLLGHKGDLMLIHFRTGFEALGQAESVLTKLRLWDFLEQTSSYLSVVELGLYESSLKTYHALAEKGLQPHTPEWNAGIQETLDRQRAAMYSRLYPEIPATKWVCF